MISQQILLTLAN